MLVRILIVDDEPEMVVILKRFLEPISSLIDSADNLTLALEMTRKNNYNIILLDLRLRQTGKAEAFRCIREFKSFGASVVVVTGVMDPKIKEEAMAAGADGFVPKDGDHLSQSLLLAANIAVLHLPKAAFRSNSFSEHVAMLQSLTKPAA